MNSSSVPAIALPAALREALELAAQDLPRRGEHVRAVLPGQVGHQQHGALVPGDRPQGVEVGLHHEVAVAALPRRHLVAGDGVHVDVDGEQVVAALGPVRDHLVEEVRGGQPLALEAAPPCRRCRAGRCPPRPPRPPSGARRASTDRLPRIAYGSEIGPLRGSLSAGRMMSRPRDAQVVVIGGGVVGAAVARRSRAAGVGDGAARGRGRARAGRQRDQLGHPAHRLRLRPRRARDRADPALRRAPRPGARPPRRPGAPLRGACCDRATTRQARTVAALAESARRNGVAVELARRRLARGAGRGGHRPGRLHAGPAPRRRRRAAPSCAPAPASTRSSAARRGLTLSTARRRAPALRRGRQLRRAARRRGRPPGRRRRASRSTLARASSSSSSRRAASRWSGSCSRCRRGGPRACSCSRPSTAR